MRYSASEKYEIIQLVQHSDLSVKRTLARLDIHKSTFYNWLARYHDGGLDALDDKKPQPSMAWNKVPTEHRQALIDFALRETDFTYFKIVGWGWYYLSTVLDDYSRFIVAWRLCRTMSAGDVSDTLDDALAFAQLNQVKVQHRPRLLSDNGPCYVSAELADYLKENGMSHTRGRPYHPQTQGKIERWHRSMKNQLLLNHYYLPGELEEQLRGFVHYYNHDRYHESIDNLTLADVCYGRGEAIVSQRKRIKQNTIALRRKNHYSR